MPLDSSVDPRMLLGRSPIPGPNPAGSSARETPQFEEVEAQIYLLERSGAAAVDWTVVIENTTQILEVQSKDLLAAAYLTFALWRRGSLSGLATGLTILNDIVSLYWDGAEPPARRVRARVSIFEWLTVRLGPLLAQAEADLAPAEEAVLARDALLAIDAVLGEKLGPAAPSLGDLARPLRALATRVEKAVAAAAKAAAAAEAAAQASAAASETPQQSSPSEKAPPPAAPPPEPGAASSRPAQPLPGQAAFVAVAAAPPAASPDMQRAVSAGREWLSSFALSLLKADVRDHRGWVLLSEATWLLVTALPPNRGGKTNLPSPMKQQINALSNQTGDPLALVLAAATFCSTSGLFWLEGQYLISQGLNAMGADAAQAVASHGRSVALALTPLPGLANLTYSDGTPFASEVARAWLEGQLAAASGAAVADRGALPWTVGAGRAQELVRTGKTDEAYASLAEGAQGAMGQARARWLLEALRLAVRTKDAAFGMALARRLTALSRDHRLAEWEPDFAADVFELAIRCLTLPEAASVFPLAERQTLLSDWSIDLSALAIGRARDALKIPLPIS